MQGIGVGVPSLVKAGEGIVYDVQNIPSWKKIHLKEILEKGFNCPVYVLPLGYSILFKDLIKVAVFSGHSLISNDRVNVPELFFLMIFCPEIISFLIYPVVHLFLGAYSGTVAVINNTTIIVLYVLFFITL